MINYCEACASTVVLTEENSPGVYGVLFVRLSLTEVPWHQQPAVQRMDKAFGSELLR